MKGKSHRNDYSVVDLKRRELFMRKSSRVAAAYLRRMEHLGDMPDGIRPFLHVLRHIFADIQNVPEAEEKKVVGSFCVMVPPELIEAAGALPIRLCSGSYTAYSIGDDAVPRDACPLVKAVIGSMELSAAPLYDGCSLLIVPVTCDCKKNLAGMLRERKPTVILQVPVSKEEDGEVEQYRKELYRLIPELEKATGGKVTAKTLAESINRRGYAQYEMARFLDFRKMSPPLLYGTHVMAVMNALSYMPALEWGRKLADLNKELEDRLHNEHFAAKENCPRILLTGSPIAFPNLKIPLLIEESGGIVAADETCMGERAIYDPAVIQNSTLDGMMRALASRSLRPCTCPTFADNGQRLFRVRQLIREHKIQGVIYHVLRGCLVYDYEYGVLEEELEKWEIPVIRVESDYNEEDVEQLKIRIEAFMELIKMRQFSARKR